MMFFHTDTVSFNTALSALGGSACMCGKYNYIFILSQPKIQPVPVTTQLLTMSFQICPHELSTKMTKIFTQSFGVIGHLLLLH